MKSRVDYATARFKDGFNCAQAVFSAYAPALGIKEDTALRLSTGFGAGMGRQQEVCGAVTGAYMVISSGHGMIDANDTAAKEKTYALVKDFTRRFCQLHSSISCRTLLGCNINTEEGKKDYDERKLSTAVCLPCVQDACRIVEEITSQDNNSRL